MNDINQQQQEAVETTTATATTATTAATTSNIAASSGNVTETSTSERATGAASVAARVSAASAETATATVAATTTTSFTTSLPKTVTTSEEEQRVSSTSSPAQLQLNVATTTTVQQQRHNQQDLSQTLENSSPAHITSTTSSPPQRMRDDETQLLQQTTTAATRTTTSAAAAEVAQTATVRTMAATVADPGGGGGGGGGTGGTGIISSGNGQKDDKPFSGSSETTNHKLILKLPKSLSGGNSDNSSNILESQREIEAATSSNCMNSSKSRCNNNVSGSSEENRRVEPLIIHLPITSSPNTSSSSSCSVRQQHHDAKKHHDAVAASASDASSCSCSSSYAEDEMNACSSSSGSGSGSVSGLVGGIPHIVPKLTIRAANEERGTSQTTVVPKIIIKMPDCNAANATNSSSGHDELQANMLMNDDGKCATSVELTPPPLPKLTIKTTMDGTTESIISSLSPTSVTSSSSSASSASSSPLVNPAVIVAAPGASNALVVPKLTIKQLQSKSPALVNDEGGVVASGGSNVTVPKLTIKTTQSGGSCVSNATEFTIEPKASIATHEVVVVDAAPTNNKAPKMTIKTGQEHTVIMTHDANNAQSIPKLTIKTKSFEVDDASVSGALNDQQYSSQIVEKIPRMTIKTIDSDMPTIPKMTISVGSADALRSGPQSPAGALVVRQSSAPTNSPDRVPKLTISRQQQDVNHCGGIESMERHLPKLTIKTSGSLDANENESTVTATKVFGMRSTSLPSEDATGGMEKIPKLTIKTLPEEFLTTSDKQPPVPKLTIKNLCSPKHKVRVVLEDKAIKVAIAESVSKKFAANVSVHFSNKQQQQLQQQQQQQQHQALPESVVVNGGESSSSQEFCGFNDNDVDGDEPRRNSDDMDIDDALQQEHDPKMFHNFPIASSNGALPPPVLVKQRPQSAQVIDTVDLTSSPSPGSSPAHNSYNDLVGVTQKAPAQNPQALINCLRLPTLTQTTQQTLTTAAKQLTPPQAPVQQQRSNILLNQLTAPPKSFTLSKVSSALPAPVPVPNAHLTSAAAKYPQLTERLMANGCGGVVGTVGSVGGCALSELDNPTKYQFATANATEVVVTSKTQKIIESIEILDTPEGSPHPSHLLNDEASNTSTEHLNNHVNHHHHHNHLHEDSSSSSSSETTLRLNNNIMLDPTVANLKSLKRHCDVTVTMLIEETHSHDNNASVASGKQRRLNVNQDDGVEANNQLGLGYNADDAIAIKSHSPVAVPEEHQKKHNTNLTGGSSTHHRSRKQKHDHILNIDGLDDAMFTSANHLPSDFYDSGNNSIGACVTNQVTAATTSASNVASAAEVLTTPVPGKRRGRPKRNPISTTITKSNTAITNATIAANAVKCEDVISQDSTATTAAKTRRVQLLRKRLAIDMVSSEQPTHGSTTGVVVTEPSKEGNSSAQVAVVPPRRDHRPLRVTRRALTPGATNLLPSPKGTRKRHGNAGAKAAAVSATSTADIDDNAAEGPPSLNNFVGQAVNATTTTTNNSFVLSSQIDLTMCSSSSSAASNGSSLMATMANTSSLTTTTANSISIICTGHGLGSSSGGGSGNNTSSSMLPPTTILSSSDPVPDVIFQPNDFSSIIATQQLRSTRSPSLSGSLADSLDDELMLSGLENSGDDSMSSLGTTATTTTTSLTPSGRGRGRGRGSRGSRGAAAALRATAGGVPRAPRLGRGASAVAKAIAMSRPRCVGGLKHTPDPERLKGLFSPLPQVFEEDTRMSADLNNSNQSTSMEPPLTPQKQPEFLNNEESQSSVVSGTSVLDTPGGSAPKQRPKKKKMEVCVSEDTEFNASTIAEYDWPPPKGCCPSKNRDTFMIQEQVALYLGIKSFKRKYPDLPRRAIDMEERNWLQEKGLVSEKMCDLGITAVWASDILDIMYADFYDKYEEYKEYIRQKHLREIEAKQKALGLSVSNGRGLQARDRAMLSASKWNAYFNKTRKEERVACLDLQTFTMNVPLSQHMSSTQLVNRTVAEATLSASLSENIPEPPTLIKPRLCNEESVASQNPDDAYPLSLVPGQFSACYRSYLPVELRSYPLSTVLDDPLTLQERLISQQEEELLQIELSDSNESVLEHDETARILESTNSINSYANSDTAADGFVSTLAPKQRQPVRRSRRARQQQHDAAKVDGGKRIITTMASTADEAWKAEQSDELDNKAELLSTSTTTSSVAVRKLNFPHEPTLASSCESGTCESSSAADDSSSSDSDSDSDTSRSSASSSCATNDTDESDIADYAIDDDDEDANDADAPLPTCGVCQRTQHCNAKNLPELFIRCYTCRRKVHPSCIEMPNRMVGRVRNYNWQCVDCKCCIKCKGAQELNKMLYCEQCDRGYHIYCLGVKTVPDGRWSCERCSFCMRCGATKPEGLPQQQVMQISPTGGDKIKVVKHKKVKWINEYRIDHITNLREHCSMLCVPCARMKPTKRVQLLTPTGISTVAVPATTIANVNSNNTLSPGNAKTANYTELNALTTASTAASTIIGAASPSASTSTSTSTNALIIAQCETKPTAIMAPTTAITTSLTLPLRQQQVKTQKQYTPISSGNSNNMSALDVNTGALPATTSTATVVSNTGAVAATTAATTTTTTTTAAIAIAPPPVVA